MRLSAIIEMYLPGEAVRRTASIWDRMKQAFGGAPALATDRTRHAFEASVLVGEIRGALRRLGITNAVSLVVDDQVIFSDPGGRPDDFGDLVLALSEHSPVFGGAFRRLRLAAEHDEAGLHVVTEIDCASEHDEAEPSATVRIGGRVQDLEPRPGEDAEVYRQRIAPVAGSVVLLEVHKKQFEAFVARLTDVLRAAFPEARVEERSAEARVVRPTLKGATPAPSEPTHPAYDPYARYYPNPFEGLLSGLLISSLMASAFRPPGLLFVQPSGAPITNAENLEAHADALAPDAPDPGFAEPTIVPASHDDAAWYDEGALDVGDDETAGDLGDLDDGGLDGSEP